MWRCDVDSTGSEQVSVTGFCKKKCNNISGSIKRDKFQGQEYSPEWFKKDPHNV